MHWNDEVTLKAYDLMCMFMYIVQHVYLHECDMKSLLWNLKSFACERVKNTDLVSLWKRSLDGTFQGLSFSF